MQNEVRKRIGNENGNKRAHDCPKTATRRPKTPQGLQVGADLVPRGVPKSIWNRSKFDLGRPRKLQSHRGPSRDPNLAFGILHFIQGVWAQYWAEEEVLLYDYFCQTFPSELRTGSSPIAIISQCLDCHAYRICSSSSTVGQDVLFTGGVAIEGAKIIHPSSLLPSINFRKRVIFKLRHRQI